MARKKKKYIQKYNAERESHTTAELKNEKKKKNIKMEQLIK